MKKLIFLFLITFQMLQAAEKDSLFAKYNFSKQYFVAPKFFCDACGCAASGGSMGFASMLNANFVGIRYFNQQYKSSDGLYSNSEWYNESFNTTQVWARIPIHKIFQISVLIPFQFHNRDTKTGKQDLKGLGDITILAMYKLFQTPKDSTKSVFHTLHFGGGIKLPTGKFDQANAGNVNPSFQVGTGSWDYLIANEYTIRWRKIGFNTMLNYVFKTENDKKYQFGNQFNYAGTFFYLYDNNKVSFSPQIGFAGEVYQTNKQYREIVRKSAGDIIFGKLGLELGRKKFSFGANVMLPINQNLASKRVEANYRWSLNLNYSL